MNCLNNPKTGNKVLNPKEISDAFNDYYESLYNLDNYADTPQPLDETISEFLASVSLPTLSYLELSQLNQPFSVTEKTNHQDQMVTQQSTIN